MTVNPVIWMFLAFGVILGLFILFYLWVQSRNREAPIRNFRDLFSKSGTSKLPSTGVKTIPIDVPPNKCPVCKTDVTNLKVCRRCGFEIERCKICSKIIKLDDEIVSCPYCGEKFHKDEFLEWLKVKAFCPNCRSELDLWEFKSDSEDNTF